MCCSTFPSVHMKKRLKQILTAVQMVMVMFPACFVRMNQHVVSTRTRTEKTRKRKYKEVKDSVALAAFCSLKFHLNEEKSVTMLTMLKVPKPHIASDLAQMRKITKLSQSTLQKNKNHQFTSKLLGCQISTSHCRWLKRLKCRNIVRLSMLTRCLSLLHQSLAIKFSSSRRTHVDCTILIRKKKCCCWRRSKSRSMVSSATKSVHPTKPLINRLISATKR